jgi:hypothetical protein
MGIKLDNEGVFLWPKFHAEASGLAMRSGARASAQTRRASGGAERQRAAQRSAAAKAQRGGGGP